MQKLFVLVYDAFKIRTTFLKDVSLIPVAVCFNKKKPEQTTSVIDREIAGDVCPSLDLDGLHS